MRAWAGVVLAGLVLSGCGTAVAATGGGARWTATGGGQQAERTPRGGPTAGSRAEAAGLAKRLLARLPLPPGTVSAGKRSVPEGMRDLPGAPGGDWAIQTRLLVAPGQPDVVSAYLQRHHPRGASVTTGSSDMFGERTLDVNFEVRAPAGIQLAELGFQIQKLTSTTSLVYADAFVVWYPARSAAEHLSAPAFRSVTVTATLNGPAGQGKHAGRTFTQRAIIAKLVAVIDDLPAVPYYAVPCPLFNTYSLRFNPLRGYGASVTVESLSCVAASVTVGGRDQPPLWDSPPRLEPLALQLLGLRSEPGSHAEIQSQIRSQTGGGPRPGSRAEALAYGRHLLTLPVLPLGTRAAKRGQHVPTEISSPAPPFAKDLVSLTRPLVAPGTPAQVQAYLLAHAPKGAERSWGQMGRPGAPTAWDVGFFLPTPQEGLYLAQLEVTMAPAANRTSVVNETAYVIWFPTRSPAENLLNPAGYRSVTVTADVVYPHTREVTRALSGLTATRLLMFLGGQQAAPDDAPVSCPMRGAEFTLRFLPAKPRTPAVRVTTYGCWADDIWINGVRQPALWDMGTLHSMTVHLLGLPGWLR